MLASLMVEPLYAYWAFSYERDNGYLKEIDIHRKDSFEMIFHEAVFAKGG